MDIITAILEIDKEASQKLKDTQIRKDAILSEAQVAEKSIKDDIFLAANKKIEKIDEIEKNSAEKKCLEIEENKQREIARFDGIYDNNHEKWESEIFNRVIEN